jgi:hypothetical protein
MRALSIRQPYAELILRGTCGEQTCGQQTCGQQIKPIEFRSRQALIIGERFYIYASQQWAEDKLFLEECRKPEVNAEVGSQRSEVNAEVGSQRSEINAEVGSQRSEVRGVHSLTAGRSRPPSTNRYPRPSSVPRSMNASVRAVTMTSLKSSYPPCVTDSAALRKRLPQRAQPD